jgi:hypothetical protein
MRHVSVLLLPLLLTAAPLLAQGAPRWTIGGEDDVQTQLGRYVGVVTTPRHIVVLERDAPFVKVFTHDGRLVQELGRRGAGPGEFGAPSSITFDARGSRLLVVDASNARVSIYPLADTLLPPRLLGLDDVGVRTICPVGERMFAVVRNAPTIVRELRESGGRLVGGPAFGQTRTAHPLGSHPMIRSRASEGPVLCNGGSSQLIVASRLLGEVHTVDLGAQTQLTHPIAQFQPMYIAVDNNSMTVGDGKVEFHVVAAVVRWGDEVLAVAELFQPQPTGPAEPSGYRISTVRAGVPAALGAKRAWRPLALLPSGALCARNDPAPAIALFAGQVCP